MDRLSAEVASFVATTPMPVLLIVAVCYAIAGSMLLMGYSLVTERCLRGVHVYGGYPYFTLNDILSFADY